jgi:hypothetical protein
MKTSKFVFSYNDNLIENSDVNCITYFTYITYIRDSLIGLDLVVFCRAHFVMLKENIYYKIVGYNKYERKEM